jgi:hypothetical protein
LTPLHTFLLQRSCCWWHPDCVHRLWVRSCSVTVGRVGGFMRTTMFGDGGAKGGLSLPTASFAMEPPPLPPPPFSGERRIHHQPCWPTPSRRRVWRPPFWPDTIWMVRDRFSRVKNCMRNRLATQFIDRWACNNYD